MLCDSWTETCARFLHLAGISALAAISIPLFFVSFVSFVVKTPFQFSMGLHQRAHDGFTIHV